jgi:hypothetical protein
MSRYFFSTFFSYAPCYLLIGRVFLYFHFNHFFSITRLDEDTLSSATKGKEVSFVAMFDLIILVQNNLGDKPKYKCSRPIVLQDLEITQYDRLKSKIGSKTIMVHGPEVVRFCIFPLKRNYSITLHV